MGSTPRFAPGSLARKQPEVDKEVEVIEMDVGGAPPTPRASSGTSKRKSADDADGSASKIRPR